MGDDKRRPYANNSATSPRRGDPRGRPSRIQHGFVSFVRGGVPRPCGVRTDPNEAVGKPPWATLAVAHPARLRPSYEVASHAATHRGNRRRRSWATTSPLRPNNSARGTARPSSFVRGGVPRPCGVRTDPNEAIGETGVGDGAPCGRDSVGDDKSRPYARTTRRRGPRRGDPRGRPSRIQHGFVSFVRGGVPCPCGVPYRPERGHRGNRRGRRRALRAR